MYATHARRAPRGARGRRALLAVLAARGVAAGAADAAQARIEVVRWRQPDPVDAEGFRIHVGARSGRYGEVIDTGALTPSSDGTYSYSFWVPDASTKYVAVSAYNEFGESQLSNEAVRRAPPSTPGRPHPPGHGGRPGAGSGRPDDSPPASPPPPTDPPDAGHPSHHGHGDHSGRPHRGDNGGGPQANEEPPSALRVPASGGLDFSWTRESELQVPLETRREPSGDGLEIRGRMRIDEPGAGIGVTLSDPDLAGVFYWLTRDARADAPFEVGSTFSDVSCVRELPAPVVGVWYRFRFAIAPGEQATMLTAKVWESGTPEPEEWAGCFDQSSDRLASVVPGLWGVGAGVKAWERVTVKPPIRR